LYPGYSFFDEEYNALYVSTEFLKLVLVALLVGVPVSWWAAHQWLQSFAYRINVGPAVFVITAVVVVVITIITVSSRQ
jgi:putative ABC transport system permease protein